MHVRREPKLLDLSRVKQKAPTRVRVPGHCRVPSHSLPCGGEHVRNRHRKDAHDKCPTCQTRFVGALSMAAAEARVRGARASSSNIDCAATTELAQACSEQGRYAEALQHYHNVLRRVLEQLGPDHPFATTYMK